MGRAIVVDGIGRSYPARGGPVHALADVTFDVAEGEVVALLGANGAGKTTLAKILSTLLLPTAGRAEVLGTDVVADPRTVRSRLSVVLGGERGLYPRLSGRDNLLYFATLAGCGRRELRTLVPDMLGRVGLEDAAGRRVETYSKGMRQRLHLAIGLITRPRVLLLDEPTVGLDPTEAARLRDTVGGLRDDGVTVLLTSHYLLDVERLADRVVMLADGRVSLDVPLADFTRRAGYAARCEVDHRGTLGEVPAEAGVDVLDVRPGEGDVTTVVLGVRAWGAESLAAVQQVVAGVEVVDLRVVPTSLEDSYAAVVAGRA